MIPFAAFLGDSLLFEPLPGGASAAEGILGRIAASPLWGDVWIRASAETAEAARAASARLLSGRRVEVIAGPPVREQEFSFLEALAELLDRAGADRAAVLLPGSIAYDETAARLALETLDARKAEVVSAAPVAGFDLYLARRSLAETIRRNAADLAASPRPLALLSLRVERGRFLSAHGAWLAAVKPTGSGHMARRAMLHAAPVSLEVLSAAARRAGRSIAEVDAADVWRLLEEDPAEFSRRPESLLVEWNTSVAAAPSYGPVAAGARIERRAAEMPEETNAHLLGLLRVLDHRWLKVSFAGVGDPLEHPRFLPWTRRLLDDAAAAAVPPYEITWYTHGLGLGEETARLLADRILPRTETNLLVRLDTADPALYARLHRGAPLEDAAGRFRRFLEFRKERMVAGPLPWSFGPATAAVMTLTPETADHVDAFFAAWPSRAEATAPPRNGDPNDFYRDHLPLEHVVLVSPSDYCGEIPDRRAADYTPLRRVPCRRLGGAITVLCDGRVAMCDRLLAPAADEVVGDVRDFDSLAEIWSHPRLAALRALHREGRWDEHPHCARCRDWHVPVD